MKLHGNMNVKNGILYIGQRDLNELKTKYGTPLYIMDEDFLRKTLDTFKAGFKADGIKTEVIYASKALSNVHILKIINEYDMGLDVVSGGEIFTALKAGFNPEKIYFHGNNKLEDELELAVKFGIGVIVLDNESEFELLKRILDKRNKNNMGNSPRQRVMLRVNIGIEAHTHEYIQTTKNDSKFGVSVFDERTVELIKKIAAEETVEFLGVHSHIGSQIFDKNSFFKLADKMSEYISDVEKKLGIKMSHMNLGGGFGVYYVEGDNPPNMEEFLPEYIRKIKESIDKYGLEIETVYIEPGRSIVCNAGSTLYTVGSTKKTYGGKNYIFVDGGMTDNIRPALYQAAYEAVNVGKVEEGADEVYTIAGKCCESGDVIIRDITLPETESGDLILVSSTGAYNFSMSSNYNKIQRPAMVFLKQDGETLAVKRQTYEDLL